MRCRASLADNACLALFVLLLFCRFWHVHLNVDLDGPSCRVEWRVLGFVPMRRRSYRLADQQLTVGAVYPKLKEQAESGSSSLGCLFLMLPFPFSLLSIFVPGGEKQKPRGPQPVLLLKDRKTGASQTLVNLASAPVAEPFLRAVHAMLPDHVDLRAL